MAEQKKDNTGSFFRDAIIGAPMSVGLSSFYRDIKNSPFAARTRDASDQVIKTMRSTIPKSSDVNLDFLVIN